MPAAAGPPTLMVNERLALPASPSVIVASAIVMLWGGAAFAGVAWANAIIAIVIVATTAREIMVRAGMGSLRWGWSRELHRLRAGWAACAQGGEIPYLGTGIRAVLSEAARGTDRARRAAQGAARSPGDTPG